LRSYPDIGAVLIAGPTASGKSALALELARELGGAIVNADSMQVYGDLRIITARPTPEEEREAPHLLYGHVDGALNYSVARYLADAGGALDAARTQGLLPIVTGGTGLYFKALLEGLSAVPPVPAEVRAELRRRSDGRASAELHAELAKDDPDTARMLQPNDRLRILRALEVLAATGRPLASFRGRKAGAVLSEANAVRVFLAPEREELRRRIDARFLDMIDCGALDEVRTLGARGLDPMLPVMRAHGVPGLLRNCRGECSLDDAVARGQADTRRYAKRQFTWFRHQMPGWRSAVPEEAKALILDRMAQRTRAGPS
jgi:tRNA dimethylallyltransferase